MLPDWLLGVSCYAATLLRRNGDFSSGAHRIARRLENLHHDHVILQRAQPRRLELAARHAGKVADGIALGHRQVAGLARLLGALPRQANAQPLPAGRDGVPLLAIDFEILAAERPVRSEE